MSTILSVLGALLVLTVLVAVHELGHFMAGRRLGFRIDEYAIGMGPVLFSREKNGTRFAVRALPIGGMCMFHGEDEGVSDPECFNAQPVWKRIIVVAAGPVMNIALALVISAGILMGYGEFMPGIVDFTGDDSPARAAGMREGDIITAVDGREIAYYEECTAAIEKADPAGAEVVVRRDGRDVRIAVRDIYDPEAGGNRLGVYIRPARLRYGPLKALGHSFRYVAYIIREMFSVLGGMFVHGISGGDVAGPVGTISIIGSAVRAGFEVVLRLGVLISVNLGIMNLLPIPALDGGRLLFMAIEAVRGRPIPPQKEGRVHFAGLVLLFGLMIALTFMDIKNLF